MAARPHRNSLQLTLALMLKFHVCIHRRSKNNNDNRYICIGVMRENCSVDIWPSSWNMAALTRKATQVSLAEYFLWDSTGFEDDHQTRMNLLFTVLYMFTVQMLTSLSLCAELWFLRRSLFPEIYRFFIGRIIGQVITSRSIPEDIVGVVVTFQYMRGSSMQGLESIFLCFVKVKGALLLTFTLSEVVLCSSKQF